MCFSPQTQLPMPYLYFPSLDVLKLVLQSQTLPASVQVRSCTAIITAQQELFVENVQQLSADDLAALEPFGVTVVEKAEQTIDLPYKTINASCWFQLVPLQKCQTDDHDLPKTIIFRTGSPEKFTALASEMLRLGNDRIGFRHVAIGPDESITLMRVIEPPYYTLIDVLDASQVSRDSDALAYREQAPRVWVRMGYQHPLAGRIDPPVGHLLLIDPPHEFHYVNEAAFLDIYQALDVRLPEPTHAWQSAAVATSLPVPLTLTATGSTAAAELWVIRNNAMQQLEQLVARSDDELIERLALAVVPNDAVPNDAEPLVILRVRPSRAAPPILILDATAYCTTMRLPNLFVPVGMRIQPPLRRDAIGKLLASDNRTLTWLESAESTDTSRRFMSFQPQSIADAAFRPLGDWVEYVLDHHVVALDTWTASHRFEFESFVCKEDVREPIEPSPGAPSGKELAGTAEVGKPQDVVAEKGQATGERPTLTQVVEESPRGSTNEFIEQLKQVEAEFVSSPDPLDAPSRFEQWLRLGQLHAHLKHQQDATICWSNLLWYSGQVTTELVELWLQAELRSSGRNRIGFNDIRILVSQADSRGKDASLVAAFVLRAAVDAHEQANVRGLAPALTQYFEQQAANLPVRVVWLTALAMHKLVGGDPLGLARVRDRLLERLYEHGLMGEFDIVSFLRGGGQNQSDHHRALRVRWRELMAVVNNWLAAPMMPKNQTRVYVKLVFAYCLARMGEVVHGRELLHQATEELDTTELVHLWMGMAFNFRVDQAAQGGNNREALPDDLVRQLEFMEPLDRYKIDRLRSHSRVLEPHERIDPYRHWHRRYHDELFQTLAELKDLLDLKKVEIRLRALLTEHTQGVRGLRVLATALEYAPRLGDEFATQLLSRVDDLLGESADVIEKALLLHRAIYVAAHFGHTPRVNSLVMRLGDELPAIVDNYLKLDNQYNPVDKERIETVENLLQHSFRGLRKLGMRNELSALYGRIAELVDAHDQPSKSTRRPASQPNDTSLARRLSLLLSVASGYYYFGNNDDADTTAAKVRHVLLEGKLPSVEQRRLAIAYIHCVSLGNPDLALQSIFELFKRLPYGQRLLPKIEDTMTTSSHFSVSELELVEACLLSLLSDESKWDPQSQLWLDQDEFAIRKKIHADMRSALM